jgi:hypothetical protein
MISVPAKSQLGGGYSRLRLDTPSKECMDGVGFRTRLPLEEADEELGGLQINLALDIIYYGSTAFESPYSIEDLNTFGLGFELAPYFKLGQSDLFLVPSVCVGGKIAIYESTHIISPYLLDKRDEKDFGFMTQVGLALTGDGAGIQVAYSWNDLNFNRQIDGTHEELYIGIFARF